MYHGPAALNTNKHILGQHFSVRISFVKKLVDSSATPRKSLGDPEVEKHCLMHTVDLGLTQGWRAICVRRR